MKPPSASAVQPTPPSSHSTPNLATGPRTVCAVMEIQKARARICPSQSAWQSGQEEFIVLHSSAAANRSRVFLGAYCAIHAVIRASIFDLSFLFLYSGSPIAVHRKHDVEWLFPVRGPRRHGVPSERFLLTGVIGQLFVAGVEEKATLHTAVCAHKLENRSGESRTQ